MRNSRSVRRLKIPNADLARVMPSLMTIDIESGEVGFFVVADLSGVRKICVESHPGTPMITQLLTMPEHLN